MNDSSGRRRSRPTGLPPRVVNRKKSAGASAARHATWVLPMIACGAFAVLIVGALGINRLVVHLRRPPVADAAAESPSESPEPAAEAVAPSPVAEGPPSSEEGMEVLPSQSARIPGRTLAKMIVVGAGAGMFASLNEALAAAIRGDVIEIRGEGPFWLEKADLKFAPLKGARPLRIRAGKGFQPVIRIRFPAGRNAVVAVENADIELQGLHFATGPTTAQRGYPSLFGLAGGNLSAQQCSLTRAVESQGGGPVLVDLAGDDCQATMESCLFRGLAGARLRGEGTRVECRNCAWLCVPHCAFEAGGQARQSVEVARNTFFNTSFLVHEVLQGSDRGEHPPGVVFRQNVFVSSWCCSSFMDFVLEPSRRSNLTREEGVVMATPFLVATAASDNLVQFWEDRFSLRFHAASPAWPEASLPMPGPLGPPVKGIVLGETLGAITAQVFRRMPGDHPERPEYAVRKAGIADLLMNSNDGATAALLSTTNYGADPRTMIDPPAIAAEPIEPKPEGR